MNSIDERIWNLIFPPRCPCCDEVMDQKSRQRGFCKECLPRISYVTEPVCKCCGKPLDDDVLELCEDCKARRHGFTQAKAVYVYEGPMREAMYRFKYSNRRAYAETFAFDATRRYGEWIQRKGIDLIVPVPMNRKKERQRGYNQAAVFAKRLGRDLSIPVNVRAVERSTVTTPQKELNASERRQNLKNAFKIGKGVVKSKRVLLVDDIYTTGATMDAVSGTLLASGVQEVYGMYVCIGRGH